ncbi:MAG: DEAD/DEAH box helicase [Bacteroidales bacterium]
MTFKDLKIIEPVLKALINEGYTIPTPIQEQAIPILLTGRDVLGCAQTGTGKTAAFSIPIIQKLYSQIENNSNGKGKKQKRRIKALILTPTRELASQIEESFTNYGKFTSLKHTVVFGGVSQRAQTNALKQGVDILVATPGRLLDLMGQGYINLREVEFFVLDEADRMLDMGFIHDIKRVISAIPQERQTLLFSATMPKEISDLAASLLHEPVNIEIAPEAATVDLIDQHLYFANRENKTSLLIDLIKEKNVESALVFSRTKHGADKLTKSLARAGINADSIHGNKSQSARQKSLLNFKRHKTRVLVATDIAARGIDVSQISHVFNYNLPEDPETYVHRIGRTGRAGHDGVALSFCDTSELGLLKSIQKIIGKDIPVNHEHDYECQSCIQKVERGQMSATRAPRGGKRQKEKAGSWESGNSRNSGSGSSRSSTRNNSESRGPKKSRNHSTNSKNFSSPREPGVPNINELLASAEPSKNRKSSKPKGEFWRKGRKKSA